MLTNRLLLPTYACFLLFFTITSGNAATIYVDAALSGGNGSSWSAAYGDLQAALSAAVNGDEIWVKNGTYYPTTGTDRSLYFQLPSGVKLYGGFAGTETSLSQWNPAGSTTILSGDIGAIGDFSDNSHTVLYTINADATTEVSGFIIRDGNADVGVNALQEQKSGAGFLNAMSNSANSSSVQLSYLTFINNYAIEQGGAIYSDGNATLIIQNSSFINNTAGNSGGAMYIGANGSGEVLNLTISESLFDNNSGKFGGAIYHGANGGNMIIDISQTRFKANRAVGSGAVGGATYSFAKSSASSIDLTFVNCIFEKNVSSSSAGGVYSLTSNNATGNTKIVNSTFYQNTANVGGAVYQNESTSSNGVTSVENCIFWENSAGYNDIFGMSGSSPSSPTIIVRNSLFQETDCDDLAFTSSNETLDCDNSSVFNADAAFTAETNGDFSLTAASDAINKGNAIYLPSGTTIDFAINPRVVNTIDIGALERQSVLPVELISFDGYQSSEAVELEWMTATEINNEYFQVERASDGRNFSVLSTVNGAGTTTLPRHYQIKDKRPFSGINYYRLKQVDFDGAFSYSDIVVVNIKAERIELFPNPVASTLHVRLSAFADTQVNYQISNITGSTILEGMTRTDAGVVTISLDEVQSFQAGTYIVNIISEGGAAVSKKFFKMD